MAKHQNLGPGGVPLHNTPREQGLSLFKTLCILNVVCVVIVFSMSGVMGMGTWGIVLTEPSTPRAGGWGTRTRTSSSSAGTSTTG